MSGLDCLDEDGDLGMVEVSALPALAASAVSVATPSEADSSAALSCGRNCEGNVCCGCKRQHGVSKSYYDSEKTVEWLSSGGVGNACKDWGEHSPFRFR